MLSFALKTTYYFNGRVYGAKNQRGGLYGPSQPKVRIICQIGGHIKVYLPDKKLWGNIMTLNTYHVYNTMVRSYHVKTDHIFNSYPNTIYMHVII